MGSRSSSRTNNITNIDENTLQLADNSVGDGARFNLGLSEGDFNGSVVMSDQGAIDAGMNLGFGALDLAGQSVAQSGALAESLTGRVIDAAGEQNKLFADELTDQLRYSDQMNAQTIDRALAIAQESNRSETADLLNKLAKYGLTALAVVVALYIISQAWSKKRG
ncbi:MAG: hypothetical protein MI745_06675 [Pseudomonadales bacterium]|nr:hypothetical protein [Pseudomonadales bacterium]